jgi:hypothetical protein
MVRFPEMPTRSISAASASAPYPRRWWAELIVNPTRARLGSSESTDAATPPMWVPCWRSTTANCNQSPWIAGCAPVRPSMNRRAASSVKGVSQPW